MLTRVQRQVRNQWAGFLALFLVIAGGGAYAAFNPIGSDGDVDACFARKSGDLDLLKGKRCGPGERRVSWSQVGPQGLEGPQGPEGQQGLQGLQGEGAVNAFMGGSTTALFNGPDEANVLPPMGVAAPAAGGVVAPGDTISPNTTFVARDLAVSVFNAPGQGKSWTFRLRAGQSGQLTCPISGSSTTCNSGDQTMTVPPSTQMFFAAAPSNAPAPTHVDFGWRAVSP